MRKSAACRTARATALDKFFPDQGPEVAFSPDGRQLVTATGPPRVWDVATRRPVLTLSGHSGIVPGVAFGPDGRRIATAGADSTVRVWDAQTGAELAVLRGHTGVVSCVAFHPDGCSLASGGRQPGDLKLWDLTRLPEHGVLGGGAAPAFAFDAQGRLKLVTIAGRVQSQSPESGQTEVGPKIDLLRKSMSPATTAAFSEDARLLAAVSSDLRTVKVFDTATGGELSALRGLQNVPYQVAFSHDGRRVAATAVNGRSDPARTVRVWDAMTGQVVGDFRPTLPISRGARPCGAVALSADGGRVAFDDYTREGDQGISVPVDGGVRICDVADKRELFTPLAFEGAIFCLALSPDGRMVAAGGSNGRIMVWDVATGRRRCEDHLELPALNLSFSPDNRRLAAVSRETVNIWDLATGKSVLTLRGRRRGRATAPPMPRSPGAATAAGWRRATGTAPWPSGTATPREIPPSPDSWVEYPMREFLPGTLARPRRPSIPVSRRQPASISSACFLCSPRICRHATGVPGSAWAVGSGSAPAPITRPCSPRVTRTSPRRGLTMPACSCCVATTPSTSGWPRG